MTHIILLLKTKHNIEQYIVMLMLLLIGVFNNIYLNIDIIQFPGYLITIYIFISIIDSLLFLIV
jgi:hypothetical protein